MPWSPLAGGFLTGKYDRGNIGDTGRLSGPNPFGNTKFTDRNWHILDVLKAVADEQGRSPAQIALAWTMMRPGVTSTLVGASKVAQIESNIVATDIVLTEDQRKRLDEASEPPATFSSALTTPAIRQMVFGGNDVTGWRK